MLQGFLALTIEVLGFKALGFRVKQKLPQSGFATPAILTTQVDGDISPMVLQL